MKQLNLLYGLLLPLLMACEKDIEFSGDMVEPMMVINSISSTDTLLEIKITKSRFFLQYGDTFETVNDATVELHVNGTVIDTMANRGNGRYRSHYRLTEGDRVRIEAHAPNLPSTSAEMLVVKPVTLVKLDTSLIINDQIPKVNYWYTDTNWTIDTIGWVRYCTVKCKLTFSDPPNEENFYRLVLYTKEGGGPFELFTQYIRFDKADVVFGETGQAEGLFDEMEYNRYGIFTDELFDGKNYPLTFSFQTALEWDVDSTGNEVFPDPNVMENPVELYINLQSLSKSYYLYLVTSSSYNEGDLFAEPVQIHSNIEGGIGLLGNYAHSTMKLSLPH